MRDLKVFCVATGTMALVLSGVACSPTVQSTASSSPSSPSFDDEAVALAESLGIDSAPDVDQVRVIPLAEWGPTMVECLNEAGWDARPTEDGEGVVYPTVTEPGMSESLNIAIYTCEVQYPVDRKYTTPLTDEQLRALYEYRTGDLTDCLATEGYDVDSTPPSLALFLESGGAWSPYEAISLDEGDAARINEACPQIPETLWR